MAWLQQIPRREEAVIPEKCAYDTEVISVQVDLGCEVGKLAVDNGGKSTFSNKTRLAGSSPYGHLLKNRL